MRHYQTLIDDISCLPCPDKEGDIYFVLINLSLFPLHRILTRSCLHCLPHDVSFGLCTSLPRQCTPREGARYGAGKGATIEVVRYFDKCVELCPPPSLSDRLVILFYYI